MAMFPASLPITPRRSSAGTPTSLRTPGTPPSLPRTPQSQRPVYHLVPQEGNFGGSGHNPYDRPTVGPLPIATNNTATRRQKQTRGNFCKNFFKRIMDSSLDDLKSRLFWRACIGECIGTLFLTLIGCGSVTEWDSKTPSVVQVSLAFGIGVATLVWCLAHSTGGHINPAVTFALMITRKISLARALLYILLQCIGAMLGAGILKGVTPKEVHGALGTPSLHSDVGIGQGFMIELLVTAVLVFTVFATIDAKRDDLKGSGPLSIGLSVTLCHLFAMKYTGCGMNPARSLGPAVITGSFHDHWIYWIGPLAGGAIAGVLYDNVFAASASLTRARDYLLSSQATTPAQGGKHGPIIVHDKIRAPLVAQTPDADIENNLPRAPKNTADVSDRPEAEAMRMLLDMKYNKEIHV